MDHPLAALQPSTASAHTTMSAASEVGVHANEAGSALIFAAEDAPLLVRAGCRNSSPRADEQAEADESGLSRGGRRSLFAVSVTTRVATARFVVQGRRMDECARCTRLGQHRYDADVRLISGLLIGAMFGAATSLINNVPGMLGEVGQAHSQDSAATWSAILASNILDSGWAWAALAFVLGWLTGTGARPIRAALIGAWNGVTGLIIATIAYYSTDTLFGIGTDWREVSFWLIRSVAFGMPLGAAGTLARRPGAVGLVAALTVPAGAAMNMALFPPWRDLPGESSAAAWAEGIVWAAAAIAVALVLVRFVRTRGEHSA